MADAKKTLQFRLIQVFSVLRCGRKQQLDIIEQAIGVRKNITELNEDEVKRVLFEVTGQEDGVA